MPRHAAFYWGAGVGTAALVVCLLLSPKYAVALAANAMFVTYLLLVRVEFPCLTAEFLQQRPDDADSPVVAIFLATLLVAGVAILFLFLTLNDGQGRAEPVEIAASVASVLLGWFTVHTMAALHYAHEYYRDDPDKQGDVLGGLAFPGDEPPDGAAFLYFSYVLGMTAQVADVAVTSRAMRRLVTVHGVVSFFFNTVIVAATVNVVVAAAGG
ncbi:DUF1345 domain-containing protein [Devosia sp. A16]|uniref:DUF1345 domain-containing protein n=1 Tax=Devosia sp. A16 TaxID=1736675 RepID=UPI0006D79C91|nr:DUF1345 domain-containing protein [Devosia sp. A16]